MADLDEQRTLQRHGRLMRAIGAVACLSLLVFRAFVEAGLARTGPLRVADVPLEYLFAAWFFAIWVLQSEADRVQGASRHRWLTYQWGVIIAALGGTLWLSAELFRAAGLGSIAWAYWVALSSVLLVFVSAASLTYRFSRSDISHIPWDALQLAYRRVTG